MKNERVFSAISLFSGAGGLCRGFKDAGFKILWANEIDLASADTYRSNNPNTVLRAGDIRKVTVKNIRDDIKGAHIDVVIGGPPCQGFSNAGKRKSDDPRNEMLFEFVRIVKGIRPAFFLMENVKGLLSMKMNNGVKFMDSIREKFKDLGYETDVFNVRAEEYGIPQKRHRIFLIGHLEGFEFIPPKTAEKGYITIEEALRGLSDNAPNNTPGILSPQTEYMIRMIPEGGSWKNVPYEKLPDRLKRIRDNMVRYRSPNFYRRFSMKEVMGTVTASATPENSGIIHPKENRKFTPRECARFQTFPDDYVFKGGVRQQYMQIGNAVPPKLGKLFAERIIASFNGNSQKKLHNY